jgi:hypothetical protein
VRLYVKGMDSKKRCQTCHLGKVTPKDMPFCLLQKLSSGSKALVHGDLKKLEAWGNDDGFAYLSVYLCVVMACMSVLR